MSIENTLERIAVALETLAGKATSGTAPAKAEPAKAEPAKKVEAKKAELVKAKADDELKDKLLALTTEAIKKHGKAADVKELLTEFGVKKASELSEDQHADYYAKLQDLVNGGSEDEDDDDLI